MGPPNPRDGGIGVALDENSGYDSRRNGGCWRDDGRRHAAAAVFETPVAPRCAIRVVCRLDARSQAGALSAAVIGVHGIVAGSRARRLSRRSVRSITLYVRRVVVVGARRHEGPGKTREGRGEPNAPPADEGARPKRTSHARIIRRAHCLASSECRILAHGIGVSDARLAELANSSDTTSACPLIKHMAAPIWRVKRTGRE